MGEIIFTCVPPPPATKISMPILQFYLFIFLSSSFKCLLVFCFERAYQMIWTFISHWESQIRFSQQPPTLVFWSSSTHCPCQLWSGQLHRNRSGLGLGVEALWPAQLNEKSLSINSLKRLRQSRAGPISSWLRNSWYDFSHVHLIQSNSQEEEQLLCCGLLRAASSLSSSMCWLLKQEESRM